MAFGSLYAASSQESLLPMLEVLLFLLIEEHVHDLLGLEYIGLEGIPTIDGGLHVLLLLGSLYNLLFNCALGDETEDRDWLSLPDTMGAILGLGINSRVPIVIIEDDCIRCRQVYS